MLLGLSNFLQSYWWVVLLFPVLLFLVFKLVRRTERGSWPWTDGRSGSR